MSAALDRSIASPPLRPTLAQAMALLRQPKVALAVLLGLATGMPPVMVTVTLGFWLRSEGIALAAIGYLSWVGLFFSFKFLWAPLVDALRLPWLARRLGHRRAWMLLGQLGVIVGILGMAATGPGGGLGLFAAWAMLTALASATQDIAVDAWRIESAADGEQEVMASAYVLGVRLGYFAGNVPIFAASAALGWPLAYACAALGGLAGLAAVVWAREPAAAVPLLGIAERAGLDGLLQALWRPLPLFWQQHGRASLLLVPLLALYFVPGGLINAMVAPLYADLGFNARQIAVVRGLFGFPAMLLGVVAAGWLGLRWGSVAALATGVSLAALSNVGFALLAWSGGLRSVWVPAAMFEGFSAGLAAAAMVALASRLTHRQATAAQFALLSSLMTLLPGLLGGLSGAAVEALQARGGPALDAYATWFLLTPLAALPPLVLLALLRRQATGPDDTP